MYGSYDEIAALYLGTAQYRANLERKLRSGATWRYGTVAAVVTELHQCTLRFKDWDLPAFMRAQELIQIGCEYMCQERDIEDYPEFNVVVRECLHEAASRFNRLCGEDMIAIVIKSCNGTSSMLAEFERAMKKLGA